jgi:hypothetical protein
MDLFQREGAVPTQWIAQRYSTPNPALVDGRDERGVPVVRG